MIYEKKVCLRKAEASGGDKNPILFHVLNLYFIIICYVFKVNTNEK